MSTPEATDRLDLETGRLVPIAQNANEATEDSPYKQPAPNVRLRKWAEEKGLTEEETYQLGLEVRQRLESNPTMVDADIQDLMKVTAFKIITARPSEPLSFSPRPASTAPVFQQMNWADACKALLDHKIVKRASWPEPAAIVFMDDDRVKIKNPDGTVHILIVSSGDMLGEDWVVAQPSV